MSEDVECPYCEKYNEINHDDGFGYEEGVKHEMDCSHCKKTFVFETAISFDYYSEKADCLNGSKHDFKAQTTFPRQFTKMCCTMCDAKREPTEKEMQIILNR